jgi:hypothetical protein
MPRLQPQVVRRLRGIAGRVTAVEFGVAVNMMCRMDRIRVMNRTVNLQDVDDREWNGLGHVQPANPDPAGQIAIVHREAYPRAASRCNRGSGYLAGVIATGAVRVATSPSPLYST